MFLVLVVYGNMVCKMFIIDVLVVVGVVFELVYINSFLCVFLCYVFLFGKLLLVIGVYDNVVEMLFEVFIFVYYLCYAGYCIVFLGKMYFCGVD